MIDKRKQVLSEKESKGLYPKYRVFKLSDGSEVDCFFVLRPQKDKAAIEAIKAYAKATDNTVLARHLLEWMEEFEDKSCIDPSRGFCDKVSSPVCCLLCKLKDECFESGEMKCFIALSGEVSSIEDCKYWSEI